MRLHLAMKAVRRDMRNTSHDLKGLHLSPNKAFHTLAAPPSFRCRWCGEPLKAVIVPTSVFSTNKRGYPVLSKAHQELLATVFKWNVQVWKRVKKCGTVWNGQGVWWDEVLRRCDDAG